MQEVHHNKATDNKCSLHVYTSCGVAMVVFSSGPGSTIIGITASYEI